MLEVNVRSMFHVSRAVIPVMREQGSGRVIGIPESRAITVTVGGERVAVFRYEGKVSAISNVCKHQNGPLGEGRIIEGCVTCPWHGYQYQPVNGCSPPPFTDKVATFRTQVVNGTVYLDPNPLPEGTAVEPSRIAERAGIA